MVAKPMQGDGPPVHEADPPYTLGERVASCTDNVNIIGALCFSRGWNRDCPRSELAPWRQIGPDMIWAVNRQTIAELHRIGPLVTDYVSGVQWVLRKKLSRLQIESAVYDAFMRLVFGDCMPADVAAMMVACRKETYLEIRAEAVAFMAFAMGIADRELDDQLTGTE